MVSKEEMFQTYGSIMALEKGSIIDITILNSNGTIIRKFKRVK